LKKSSDGEVPPPCGKKAPFEIEGVGNAGKKTSQRKEWGERRNKKEELSP